VIFHIFEIQFVFSHYFRIKIASESAKMEDSDNEETPTSSSKKEMGGRSVVVILDLASLETVKTKKGDFQLLNCDDHVGLMRKHNKNPQQYRPDIVHQELMAVLDSPLNKAGKVKLYMHTEKNVLVEINPKTRLPRTFKRFSGLMVRENVKT
jgi:rRNA small subunit pseudouridine methyltransferase Nep1